MYSKFEGIDKLRTGALILVMAFIFIIIAFSVYLYSVALVSQSLSSFLSVLGALTTYIVIVNVIGLFLVLVGLYYLRDGFKMLYDLGLDVESGYTGVRLTLIGIVLSFTSLSSLVVPLLSIFTSSLIGLAGNIIIFIGNVLIGIGFYNLGKEYNEGKTKIGGILLIFFPPLGYILTYLGLGKIGQVVTQSSLDWKKATGKGVVITLSSQPQIYQVGQGIIKSNGAATITLYSPTQATILSARIEGTKITSVNINPIVLQPGHNNVTIQFNDVSSLVPYTNYNIILVVNIGGKIAEVRATASY